MAQLQTAGGTPCYCSTHLGLQGYYIHCDQFLVLFFQYSKPFQPMPLFMPSLSIIDHEVSVVDQLQATPRDTGRANQTCQGDRCYYGHVDIKASIEWVPLGRASSRDSTGSTRSHSCEHTYMVMGHMIWNIMCLIEI